MIQLKPFFDICRDLLSEGTSGAILAQPDERGFMNVRVVNASQTEAIQKIMNLSQFAIESGHQELEITRSYLRSSQQRANGFSRWVNARTNKHRDM